MSSDVLDIVAEVSGDGGVPWQVQRNFYEEQLTQKDQDMHLAGEIGKKLLEDNNELSARLEITRKELTHRIEELEQENYGYQRKLETSTHLQKSFEEELENLRTMQASQIEFLETGHEMKLNEVKKQMSSLQDLLDKQQLTEQQLKERNASLEERLADTQQDLDQHVNQFNETSTDELASLSVEVNTLKQEKMCMMTELSDCKNKCAQLHLESEAAKKQLHNRDVEIEEIQCQTTSYINALEKSREEVLELKVELDQLKATSQDHKEKGNSLFGEVEDKRIQAEKDLIAQKVQFDSLNKEHESMKQQFHKLKVQMAGVLQMCTGKGSNDVEYLTRVQSQLHKAQTNIKSLLEKLHTLEKRPFMKSLNTTQEELSQQPYATNLQDYLQNIIKAKEEEIAKLKEEQLTMQLCLNFEESKGIELERQMHETTRQMSKLQSQNLKLHLKVEELRMKYEPEKFKIKSRRVIEERIPLTSKGADSQGNIENGEEDIQSTVSPKHEQYKVSLNEQRPFYSSMPKSSQETSIPRMSVPKTAHLGANTKTEPIAKRPLIVSQSRSGSEAIARPLKSRSVSISDDVAVHSISPRLDRHRAANQDGTGRPRGRQHYSYVIDAKPKTDCKVQ